MLMNDLPFLNPIVVVVYQAPVMMGMTALRLCAALVVRGISNTQKLHLPQPLPPRLYKTL